MCSMTCRKNSAMSGPAQCTSSNTSTVGFSCASDSRKRRQAVKFSCLGAGGDGNPINGRRRDASHSLSGSSSRQKLGLELAGVVGDGDPGMLSHDL